MAENLKVQAAHFVIHPITGNAGDAHLKTQFTVQVLVPTIELAMAIEPEEVLITLGIENAVCTGRPFKQHTGAEPGEMPGFIVSFNFEGTNGLITGVEAEKYATIELRPTMREVPIERHPFFKELKERYGWDSAKRGFSEILAANIPAGPEGHTLAGQVSPMFGVTSFKAFGATLRRTRVVSYLSGADDIFARAGLVWDPAEWGDPPGLSALGQSTPPGQMWLMLMPTISQPGKDGPITIVEEWELSGPLGIVKDVYRLSHWE